MTAAAGLATLRGPSVVRWEGVKTDRRPPCLEAANAALPVSERPLWGPSLPYYDDTNMTQGEAMPRYVVKVDGMQVARFESLTNAESLAKAVRGTIVDTIDHTEVASWEAND